MKKVQEFIKEREYLLVVLCFILQPVMGIILSFGLIGSYTKIVGIVALANTTIMVLSVVIWLFRIKQ
jgi:hypothetical protein